MYSQPYPHPYTQSHLQFQSGAVSVSPQSQQHLAMSHPQPKLFQDGSAPVFRACSSAMQRPTLTNVRIRSTRDANQIFYAVLRNLLPMTVRRLDAEERRAITSGNVYVWEERGASSEATGLGIERWTDGMRWSPSRVRDEFLFYHQKEMDPDEAADLPPTRCARIVRPKANSADASPSDISPEKIPHQRPLNDPEKLIKQTYSVLVALPEDSQRGVLRKWHLTAYFTQSTVDSLQTVDEVLPKPHGMVPEGLFRSARAGKMRRDTTSSRVQQQQRQLGYYDPEAAGPSGSSPVSGAYQPSPSFSPYAPSYAHMTPHAYAYSHTQPQYSPYVQDEVAVHRQASAALPPPPPIPPAGGPYSITPAPRPTHPSAPPPPQGQNSINGHGRGIGLGLTYARPPREWDGVEQQQHLANREREPREQMRYERDLERCERASVSPQRIPSALPNTFDPTRGRAFTSASAATSSSAAAPLQTRSPSYTSSHPYANAFQGHLARSSSGGAGAGGSGSQPPVSEYYSPAKPIKPIDVSPSRNQRVQAPSSPASGGSIAAPGPSNAYPRESGVEEALASGSGSGTGTPNGSNNINANINGGGASASGTDPPSEIGEQRESAIGPTRSPRHKNHTLTHAHNRLSSSTVTTSGSRLSASPRSLPSASLSRSSDSVPRLRSVSFSGSAVARTGRGAGVVANAGADQGQGPTAMSPNPNLNNRSPAGGMTSLDGERARSLVPLQSLENALFPRRDPTDDALLRRFNALRTTPPTSSARDE